MLGSLKKVVAENVIDNLSNRFHHSLSQNSGLNAKLSYWSASHEAGLMSLTGSTIKVIRSPFFCYNFDDRQRSRSSFTNSYENRFIADKNSDALPKKCFNPSLASRNEDQFSLRAKRDEFGLADGNFSVPNEPMAPPSFHLNMIVRILYTSVMYGIMAIIAKMICEVSGVPFGAGFEFNTKTILLGGLFSLPPAFFLLLIQQDFCTRNFPPAKAIKDAEEEEVLGFFYGMEPWQYIFICSIAAVAEELFFRSAVQGSLFHFMQSSGKEFTNDAYGMAALVGFFPPIVPCSQAFAAFLTATIKGSIFYIISAPKISESILILPKLHNQSEINKKIGAWYQHQELKKIYSPLLEALVSLYIGFEWLYTGSILCPILTYALYSITVVWYSIEKIKEEDRALRDQMLSIIGEFKELKKAAEPSNTDLSSNE